MIEGEKFADWVGASKMESGIVLGVDMRSLRVPLHLRGVGSTDRTGSISLEGTKK